MDSRGILRIVLAVALPSIAVTAAGAGSGPLDIELNRLEQREDGCRMDFVLTNGSARSYSSLKLDLAVFAETGVISDRFLVETAPLAAQKTTVRQFRINKLNCSDAARVLLSDVPVCQSNGQDLTDCLALVKVSSRAGVAFVK